MYRFLIPNYLFYSLKIKYLKHTLSSKYQEPPLKVFKPKHIVNKTYYTAKELINFHSLSYHTSASAQRFYGDLDFITTHIIKGLIYWNEENRNDDIFLSKVENILQEATLEKGNLFFYLNEEIPKYSISGQIFSGLIQGKGASLIMRAYHLTQDEKYLNLALQCLNTLLIKIEDGGVLRQLPNDQVWSEEYPSSDKPCMVLNGHLFTIIGLADYLAVAQNDNLQQLYDQLINSTLTYLDLYFTNGALLYSMYHWTFCNVHYLGLMVPLFEHVYMLTEVEEFKHYATKLKSMHSDKTFKKLIKA